MELLYTYFINQEKSSLHQLEFGKDLHEAKNGLILIPRTRVKIFVENNTEGFVKTNIYF